MLHTGMAIQETRQFYSEYCAVMRELKQIPGHKNDKLKDLLNAQTGLSEDQKIGILEAWEDQDIETKVDLAAMEELIRTKSAQVSEYNVKFKELNGRSLGMARLYQNTRAAKKLIKHYLVFPKGSHFWAHL